MIIETEPADLLMIRYKLYFNQHRPDPEDPWILAYFEQYGLEPRRQLQEEHEGIPYKVLHFGQCYLGRHVEALGKLYQRGVEHTLLAHHIHNVLSAADDPTIVSLTRALGDEALAEASTTLAAQLYEQTTFEVREAPDSDERHLQAVIASEAIQDAFRTWHQEEA